MNHSLSYQTQGRWWSRLLILRARTTSNGVTGAAAPRRSALR